MLSSRIVDVVACPLRATSSELEGLRELLSPDERERAGRFRLDGARARFVVGRGVLRRILGRLTGLSPASVRFVAGPGGKPRLAEDSRLRFNVAHSDDLMLCALTLDLEVGVDVERVRDDLDHQGIARRFFAPPEVQALDALAPARRLDAFFACWTRKESVVKATGEGLGRELDTFVVSVDPDHAAMLSTDVALGPPEGWSLLPLPVPSGYQGTVAIRGPAALRAWTWPVAWIDSDDSAMTSRPESPV